MGRSVTHILSLLSLLGFTACSGGDDVVSDTTLVPVVFAPRIEGALTRAVDQTWSADDKVGIAMVKGTALTTETFKRYEVSGVTLTPLDGELYYPPNGDKVKFVAFSPYTTVTSNTVTYNTFADQESRAKMEAVDFLYSNEGGEYNKNSDPVALTFTHKFSKIIITATTPGNATKVDLSSLEMTITGTPGSATVDLTTGLPTTLGDAAPITPYYNKSSHVATAILVPHLAKAGRTIEFKATVDESYSITSTYDIPSDFKFDPGHAYSFTFNVTREGVTLVGTIISPWGEGNLDWEDVVYTFELTSDIALDYANTPYDNVEGITFKSNYGGTLSVVLSTSSTDAGDGVPTWVNGTLSPPNPDALGYTDYTYTFDVQANGLNLARTVYAHVVGGTGAESLAVVTLTQAAKTESLASASNCYIVAPGATVYIPVSRANEHAADAIGSNDAFTAEFLWADAPKLLSNLSAYKTSAGGVIEVTAAGGKSGNAVVAVKVGEEIKWSWHIWVTGYDPADADWMDRHLGALSGTSTDGLLTYGLYYQWGRKDPFPRAGAINANTEGKIYTSLADGTGTTYVIATATGPVEYDYSVKNPTTFATSSDAWANTAPSATVTGDDVWGPIDNANKTIYDPCPKGYRVAVHGSWSNNGWSEFSNYGRNNDNFGGWYAAFGMRNARLSSVGKGFLAWTAQPNGTGAWYMDMWSGGDFHQYPNLRMQGFGVRCRKE